MTDELERIRSLHDAAPGPSTEWVDRTRSELLAMAADEEAAEAGTSEAPEGLLARLRRRVADLVDVAPPIAWAGAAAVVAVVAVVAVLGRSPAPAPPTAQPTTSPSATEVPTAPSDAVVLASSCSGSGGAYTVGYPEGWHANPGDVTGPCQLFAEEPVELEEQTGGAPTTPVTVRVVPVAFDRATAPEPASRELSREATTVEGRDAVRVDWVSTGDAALPVGVHTHRWFVDLGDQRTLMLAAYEGIGANDFDHHRRVVDEMARTIELAPTD